MKYVKNRDCSKVVEDFKIYNEQNMYFLARFCYKKIPNIKMFFTFSETSNFDDAPKWDEAQRETVNRNLSIEFDAENTTHETDTTDDASAINRNQKFNQSKVCLFVFK